MPQHIHHALVLNFHQPSGNIEQLLDTKEWEAKEILWALDRMPRSLWGYEDVARVHLSLSGTLLETLSDPRFQARVYGIVKCGDLLWYLQNTSIFQVLGTGYYHPVLPLTPKADWDEHLGRWQGIASHLLARSDFPGFWPPEMGFCMEMIPVLKRFGYRYVLVDSKHVDPVGSMRWEEVRYRPHTARFGDDEIVVIVRDRELSDAQEAGLDWGWFAREVNQRTRWCDFVPLVTTCTDGENGGWFRNSSDKGNFWGVFYRPYLQKVRSNECNISPTFITDYLRVYGAAGYVTVKSGAWNTGWHHGEGFLQWTGSRRQKDALKRVEETSRAFHVLRQEAQTRPYDQAAADHLREAHWRLLRAETSCNFFWGDTWIDKCNSDLDDVSQHLGEIERED